MPRLHWRGFVVGSGLGGASADALIAPTSQTLERITQQRPGAFTPAAPVRFHLVHIDDHVVQGTQENIEADELRGAR